MAKQHTGKSDKSFSDAVRNALKDVEKGGTFTVEQTVELSYNPGVINFAVTLTPISGS
jgi:hypothetical protein